MRTTYGASVKVKLVTDAGEFDVSRVDIAAAPMGYGMDFPMASISLAMGKVINKTGGGSQVTAAQHASFLKWQTATVVCTVAKVPGLEMSPGLSVGSKTIFKGTIVDVDIKQEASMSGGGSISYAVKIAHVMSGLYQGDLSTYPVFGATCMSGAFIERGTGSAPSSNKMGMDIAQKRDPNFFKFISDIFLRRANPASGGAPVIVNAGSLAVGPGGNIAQVLATISSNFIIAGVGDTPLLLMYQAFILEMMSNITYEVSYATLLSMFLQKLSAWTIPTATGMKIRPLAAATLSTKIITAGEYTAHNMVKSTFNGGQQALLRFIGGAALYITGSIGRTVSSPGQVPNLAATYYLPKGLAKGGVLMREDAPPWLNFILSPDITPPQSNNPTKPTDGDRPENLAQTQIASEINKYNSSLSRAYLSHRTVALALGQSSIQLVTPLRFDIGVGTGVSVEIPDTIPGGKLGTYCGIVTSLKICIDADQKTLNCVYTIGSVAEKSIYSTLLNDGKNPFTNASPEPGAWTD